MLHDNNPHDIANVVVKTNAPTVNQITEFDVGIEGRIGNCPYNFISLFKTGHAPTMPIAEARETHVPVSNEVGNQRDYHNSLLRSCQIRLRQI